MKNAGVKTKTFVKYRAALVDCGILQKVYKIHNGPALYAIGTYNDTTNRQRVSRFLKGTTVSRIARFKLSKQ